MSDTKALKSAWQDAESAAIALQNEKDAAIDKVRAKYGKPLRAAVDKAAKAQKTYLDAEAADGLRKQVEAGERSREDAEAVAAKHGLKL